MIESASNPQLKHLKRLLHSRKARHDQGQYVLENRNYILDTLKRFPELVVSVYAEDADRQLREDCLKHNVPFIEVAPTLLNTVSHVKTSQGMMAIVRMHQAQCDQEAKDKSHLYLSAITNPSNFGSICRNAAAFNVTHIFFPKGSVDPFHPESVRASGGWLPLLSFKEMDIHDYCTQYDRPYLLLSSNQGESLYDMTCVSPVTIILGSEMGLDEQLTGARVVTIPMANDVDSLNVAVTSGIVLSALYSKDDLNSL